MAVPSRHTANALNVHDDPAVAQQRLASAMAVEPAVGWQFYPSARKAMRVLEDGTVIVDLGKGEVS